MSEINAMPYFSTIEDHDKAYKLWRAMNIKDRILVHIDAHIDFNWIDDEPPCAVFDLNGIEEIHGLLKERNRWNLAQIEKSIFVGIDNYIYPAIKEGIVKEFYWVVPDKMLKDSKQKKKLKRILQHLKDKSPRNTGAIKVYFDRLETYLLNIKTTVVTLSSLPGFKEEVLLDIDTDFMLIDSLNRPAPYFSKKTVFPWILPEGIVHALQEKGISSLITTIAYSVEGGFTPLIYKFLGDELKVLLSGQNNNNHFALLHKALDLYNSGRSPESALVLEQSLNEVSLGGVNKAAVYYLLFQIYREANEIKALEFMRMAVSFDGSYQTIYNNRGFLFQRFRNHKEAIKEFSLILKIFPEAIDYRLHLSDSLIALGRLDDALLEYQLVLETQPDNAKALSLSGYIYLKKKDYVMAREFLLKALEITEQDAFNHYWLGVVYEKLSHPRMAIKHLQRSTILGLVTEGIYLRLSLLHMREGNFFRAGEKLFLAIKKLLQRRLS